MKQRLPRKRANPKKMQPVTEHVPPPARPSIPEASAWQPREDQAGGHLSRQAASRQRRRIAALSSGPIEPPFIGSSTSVDETAAAADTESATVTTPAAVLETVGALDANATIVAGGVGVATGSALSERPAEIRDAARALSREFTAQVEELQRSRPNEPDHLAKHDDLVAFFEKMAVGLATLADALDRAVSAAAEGKPEPAFLGQAAEVVRQLQLGAMEWLEKNRTTVIEVPFRIGLFGFGLTFLHAIGLDGAVATYMLGRFVFRGGPTKTARESMEPRQNKRQRKRSNRM